MRWTNVGVRALAALVGHPLGPVRLASSTAICWSGLLVTRWARAPPVGRLVEALRGHGPGLNCQLRLLGPAL